MLYWWLRRIAQYADDARLANIGLELKWQQFPQNAKKTNRRIYGTHNMSNNPDITPEWCGRLNDDTLHAINVWRLGQHFEMQIKFLSANTPATQDADGGLTSFYQQVGTLRKTAYVILMAPNTAKLKIFLGRYHHDITWRTIAPRLISEKWQRL